MNKNNTAQQALCLLGPKIWTEIGYSTTNVKTTASSTHALKRKILNKLCI